ncbi:hypothetical protein HDV04_000726 [Boothiomyces sp. JEL0838]|nr:hypothetical protein HDV04_000726 [Boothiomyces sp. JEL0838]
MFIKALLVACVALAKSQCTETIYRKDADDYTEQEWNELAKAVDLAMHTIVDGFDKYGNRAKVSFWESQVPFHRKFLLETEAFLHKLNPNFKAFPYFNELLHANSPYTQPVIKRTASMTTYGSDRTYDNLGDTLMTYDQFSSYVSKAEDSDGFAYFAKYVEYEHALVHNDLGGTIETMYSPKDVMFYLHHACYDRFWSLAQSMWAAKDASIPQWTDFSGNPIDFDTYLPGYDGSCENKDTCTFGEIFSCGDICVVYVPKGEHPPAVTTTTVAPVKTTTTVAPVQTTTTTVAPVVQTTTTVAPVVQTTTTVAPVVQTTTTVAPVVQTTTVDNAKTTTPAQTTPVQTTVGQTTKGDTTTAASDIPKGTTTSAPATTTTAVIYPVIPPSIYPPTTQCHSKLSQTWLNMLNMTDAELKEAADQCQSSYDNAKQNVPVKPIQLIPACDQEQHLAQVVVQQQNAQTKAPTLPNYTQQTADESEDCEEDEATTTDVGAAYGQATDIPTVQTTAAYNAPVVSYAEKASAGLFLLALFL